MVFLATKAALAATIVGIGVTFGALSFLARKNQESAVGRSINGSFGSSGFSGSSSGGGGFPFPISLQNRDPPDTINLPRFNLPRLFRGPSLRSPSDCNCKLIYECPSFFGGAAHSFRLRRTCGFQGFQRKICCDEDPFFSTPAPTVAREEMKSVHASLSSGCNHGKDRHNFRCNCDDHRHLFDEGGASNGNGGSQAENSFRSLAGGISTETVKIATSTTAASTISKDDGLVQDEEDGPSLTTTTVKATPDLLKKRISFPDVSEYFRDDDKMEEVSTLLPVPDRDGDESVTRIESAFEGDDQKSTLTSTEGTSKFPDLKEFFPDEDGSDPSGALATTTIKAAIAMIMEAAAVPDEIGSMTTSSTEASTLGKMEMEETTTTSMETPPPPTTTTTTTTLQPSTTTTTTTTTQPPTTTTTTLPTTLPQEFPDVTESVILGSRRGTEGPQSLQLDLVSVIETAKNPTTSSVLPELVVSTTVPTPETTIPPKMSDEQVQAETTTTANSISFIETDTAAPTTSSSGRQPYALSNEKAKEGTTFSPVSETTSSSSGNPEATEAQSSQTTTVKPEESTATVTNSSIPVETEPAITSTAAPATTGFPSTSIPTTPNMNLMMDDVTTFDPVTTTEVELPQARLAPGRTTVTDYVAKNTELVTDLQQISVNSTTAAAPTTAKVKDETTVEPVEETTTFTSTIEASTALPITTTKNETLQSSKMQEEGEYDNFADLESIDPTTNGPETTLPPKSVQSTTLASTQAPMTTTTVSSTDTTTLRSETLVPTTTEKMIAGTLKIVEVTDSVTPAIPTEKVKLEGRNGIESTTTTTKDEATTTLFQEETTTLLPTTTAIPKTSATMPTSTSKSEVVTTTQNMMDTTSTSKFSGRMLEESTTIIPNVEDATSSTITFRAEEIRVREGDAPTPISLLEEKSTTMSDFTTEATVTSAGKNKSDSSTTTQLPTKTVSVETTQLPIEATTNLPTTTATSPPEITSTASPTSTKSSQLRSETTTTDLGQSETTSVAPNAPTTTLPPTTTFALEGWSTTMAGMEDGVAEMTTSYPDNTKTSQTTKKSSEAKTTTLKPSMITSTQTEASAETTTFRAEQVEVSTNAVITFTGSGAMNRILEVTTTTTVEPSTLPTVTTTRATTTDQLKPDEDFNSTPTFLDTTTVKATVPNTSTLSSDMETTTMLETTTANIETTTLELPQARIAPGRSTVSVDISTLKVKQAQTTIDTQVIGTTTTESSPKVDKQNATGNGTTTAAVKGPKLDDMMMEIETTTSTMQSEAQSESEVVSEGGTSTFAYRSGSVEESSESTTSTPETTSVAVEELELDDMMMKVEIDTTTSTMQPDAEFEVKAVYEGGTSTFAYRSGAVDESSEMTTSSPETTSEAAEELKLDDMMMGVEISSTLEPDAATTTSSPNENFTEVYRNAVVAEMTETTTSTQEAVEELKLDDMMTEMEMTSTTTQPDAEPLSLNETSILMEMEAISTTTQPDVETSSQNETSTFAYRSGLIEESTEAINSTPAADELEMDDEIVMQDDITSTMQPEIGTPSPNETHASYGATTEYPDESTTTSATSPEATSEVPQTEMEDATVSTTLDSLTMLEMTDRADEAPVTEITKSIRREPDTDKTIVKLTSMTSKVSTKVRKTIRRGGGVSTTAEYPSTTEGLSTTTEDDVMQKTTEGVIIEKEEEVTEKEDEVHDEGESPTTETSQFKETTATPTEKVPPTTEGVLQQEETTEETLQENFTDKEMISTTEKESGEDSYLEASTENLAIAQNFSSRSSDLLPETTEKEKVEEFSLETTTSNSNGSFFEEATEAEADDISDTYSISTPETTEKDVVVSESTSIPTPSQMFGEDQQQTTTETISNYSNSTTEALSARFEGTTQEITTDEPSIIVGNSSKSVNLHFEDLQSVNDTVTTTTLSSLEEDSAEVVGDFMASSLEGRNETSLEEETISEAMGEIVTSTITPMLDDKVRMEGEVNREELVLDETSSVMPDETTEMTTTGKEDDGVTEYEYSTGSALQEVVDAIFGPSGRSARVNNLGESGKYASTTILSTSTQPKTTTTPEPPFKVEVKVGPYDSRSLFSSDPTSAERELQGEISNVVGQLLLTTHKNFHLLPNFLECAGARGRTGRRKTKVLQFDTDNYPWMARIGFREPGGVLFPCAGTIITRRYILTSAHCATGKSNDSSTMEILLEGAKLAAKGVTGDQNPWKYKVEKVVVHPNYDKVTRENDLAVIRLADEIPEFNGTSEVKPICLPFEDGYGVWDSLPSEGQTAYFGGWGYVLKNMAAKVEEMEEAAVTIWSNDNCTYLYRGDQKKKITSHHICAYGKAEKDACRGDAGGPLMALMTRQRIFFQIGIVSYGPRCGYGVPGVYTRVSDYLSWILDSMQP